MPGTDENGMNEFWKTGVAVAYAVRGAVKTGKTVAGAAKGAAAGGLYGAAVGTLLAGGGHLGKIAAVVALFLILPVLFVTMLPGLLYGGFLSGCCPADPDTPVLNSSTAITENANAITFAINSVFSEALDEVMAQIEMDFAASGGDKKEIVNPYASGPVYNANLFVSQYCAFRNDNFGDISIDDMENMLRGGKKHLYSFRRREEMRDRKEMDPKTGEETIISEKWMVYTVSYNGEEYFADQVFGLTDSQRSLAEDYAQNMSLFLGDGLLQDLTEWDGNSIPSMGEVCFTDGATEVVYFSQLDERYASRPYGTDSVGRSGCGPACMAIVISSLAGEYRDPAEMAQWSYENGYWCKGSGSYHALIPAAAANWGLPVSGCTVSEPQRILDALADGRLVVVIMSEGHFTKGGHFIVLCGVKDEKIMVADPASYKRSGQLWDLSVILNEASRRAGAGGPFWIIG